MTYKPIPNYPNPPPPGLNRAVEAAGIHLRNYGDNEWQGTDPDGAQAIADAFDPSAHVKEQKAAELADTRWQKEVGGILYQPELENRAYRFKTSRESMGPILGAMIAIQQGVLPQPLRWKTDEGLFVSLTGKDVVELFKMFAAHVNAAFAEEDAKQQQVADETDWTKIIDIKISEVEAAPTVDK